MKYFIDYLDCPICKKTSGVLVNSERPHRYVATDGCAHIGVLWVMASMPLGPRKWLSEGIIPVWRDKDA
jgi:hypothetical protein